MVRAEALPWWRRPSRRVNPWVRAVEVSFLIVFAVGVAAMWLPRAVVAPIERTFASRLPAPLGAYPDVESLGRVARAQMAGPKPGVPLLVWASRSFRGDTNGWESMRIAGDGRILLGRDLWNYALQGGSRPYLGASGASFDPRAVQTRLDRLGPSVSPAPPVGRALFVSFARGGVWETRVYDRAAPPAELEAAERLAGAWPGEARSQDQWPTWTQAGAAAVPGLP